MIGDILVGKFNSFQEEGSYLGLILEGVDGWGFDATQRKLNGKILDFFE